MKAENICKKAAELVGGDRATTHGDKRENHQHIAALWNAYLGWRLIESATLSARDVAVMMVLLKVARMKTGTHNPDDYIDAVGYAAIAGELAS